VSSLLIPSCHRQHPLRRERRTPFSTYSSLGRDEDPSARVGAARTRRIRSARSGECGVTPQPARVESRFIDDHVAGADKQGGVGDRRDWNCNGDRQAGPNRLWGVWRRSAGAAPQPGLSTGRELRWHLGRTCGQLKHQYKPGDDRMEKLLLTVCGRPQTCSVSVGRDRISGSTPSSTTRRRSVGRGESPASVRRLADGQSAS
jgi:hypothetical protein